MNGEPRKTILIVDDNAMNSDYLVALLGAEGYLTLRAENGQSGLETAEKQLPDLILLDAMMPDLDGFQVARRLKEMDSTRSIPIIMITALSDRESRLRALRYGVEEFLSKPLDRLELSVRVRNLLRLKEYSDFLAEYNRTLEAQVAERSSQLVASHFDTIYTIVRAAEFRDEDTGAHIKRISFYARELASRLRLDSEFVETIQHASMLHDVGKIGVPDHILLKPGPCDAQEWEVMKTHTNLGSSILGMGKSASPYTNMGSVIALCHHEKWNGRGYPNALAKENIPLPARIMSVCDVYDALRSRRPYKRAFSHNETVRIILDGDGRTSPDDFDPAVLDSFSGCAATFHDIYEMHVD